jgi:hypothetical protein
VSTAQFLIESLYTGKLTSLIVGTVTVDPGSINGGASGNTDVSVDGLTTRHKVVAMCQGALEAGLVPQAAYVPSDGTLRIRLYNATVSPIDGDAREWFFIAWIP